MFLTHRDDVADHEAFARHFGCQRVLHERDVTDATRGVERKVSGVEPVRLDDDLLVIPTPGHTRGHAVLLYREKFLFTGDHLAWSARRGGLDRLPRRLLVLLAGTDPLDGALLDFSFEWVLPATARGTTRHPPRP